MYRKENYVKLIHFAKGNLSCVKIIQRENYVKLSNYVQGKLTCVKMYQGKFILSWLLCTRNVKLCKHVSERNYCKMYKHDSGENTDLMLGCVIMYQREKNYIKLWNGNGGNKIF